MVPLPDNGRVMRGGLIAAATTVLILSVACRPPETTPVGRGDALTKAFPPPGPPPPRSSFLLGVILATNSSGWARLIPRSDTPGALVVDVIPGSPAATLGIGRGDVIAGVDDEPIRSSERPTVALRSSQNPEHRITIARPGREDRILRALLAPAAGFSTIDFLRERYLQDPDPVNRYLYAQQADDPGAALPLIDQLIAESPGFAHAHALRARRLFEQWSASGQPGGTAGGEAARIREGFAKAIDLDPGSTEIRIAAARTLLGLAEPAEAQRQAAKAVELDDALGEARGVLGLVLLASGKAAASLPHLHRAVALNPFDLNHYAALSQAYVALDKRLSALLTIESAKRLTDDPLVHQELDSLVRPQPATTSTP